jgi:hypothetical protein
MESSYAYNLKPMWFERMMDGKYKTILLNIEEIVETLFQEYSVSYVSYEELELDTIVDDASNAIQSAPAAQKIDLLYDAAHAMVDIANENLESIYNFMNSSPGFTKPKRQFIDKKPILAGLDKLIQEKIVKANLTKTKGSRNLLKTRRKTRKARKSRKSRR